MPGRGWVPKRQDRKREDAGVQVGLMGPKSAPPLKGRQTFRAAVCATLGTEGTKEAKESYCFPQG